MVCSVAVGACGFVGSAYGMTVGFELVEGCPAQPGSTDGWIGQSTLSDA